MAARQQITCINKSERLNPHERILSIGGFNADGKRWRISQEEAVSGIRDGSWAFFVDVNGKSVDVVVATSANNNFYIKTQADGVHPNNLLALTECKLA